MIAVSGDSDIKCIEDLEGKKISTELVNVTKRFFEEKNIRSAMESVPSAFTIKARNPAKSIRVGDDNFVMAPGYGPPFIIEPSGEKRDATLDDVQNFCKLVHTSKHLDFNSSMVVQPGDVHQDTAHLDILLSTMLLTTPRAPSEAPGSCRPRRCV